MDFRRLEDFPNFTKRKLDNIIKATDKYDLDSVSYNNKLHQLTNILKHLHGSDICFLETHINLTKTFREYKNNKTMEGYMENMWCGYYDDTTPKNSNFIKLTYKEDHLISQIHNLMLKSKMIFIYLCLHDYLLHPADEDDDCHEQVTHSTALILYKTNNKYRAFYYNSYGQYGDNINYYDLYITKFRKTRIVLNHPVDHIIINQLINTFNNKAPLYFDNCMLVKYQMTPEFNYYGPNYQQGDFYGVCFIYPFIFAYELICNLYNQNILDLGTEKKALRAPSYKNLIDRNQLNNVILIMMSKIYKNLRTEFINYYFYDNLNDYLIKLNKLNKIIDAEFESGNTFHIKQIYAKVIEFITQKPFRIYLQA